MALTPGSTIDSYEILAPLGVGGMGEVYCAYDRRLQRSVAIKVLPEFLSADPERLRRFEQEARAAAALNHPNILTIYELGMTNGVPYLVLELLEGETLRESLAHGPLSLGRTIAYGIQIAHGLAAAHAKEIVHRDLKPENLFATRDGRVKILDFGLAKFMQPQEGHGELALTMPLHTQPGIVLGSIGYMSPEQVRAQPADHRSDIFSLGVILYEMVTGKRPFQRPTSADTISASLHEDPPDVSHIEPSASLAFQRIVNRCLEKNPAQRFQSASDLAFALEAVSDPTLSSVAVPRQEERANSARPLIAAAAMLAVSAALLLGYLWMQRRSVPKVSHYVQLTHDGQRKSLIGTDGSRLYLDLVSSGRSDPRGIAVMPVSGGEFTRLASVPSPDMVAVDLSPDGSELLVVDARGVPPKGPLWRFPVVGGSPRRLGDTIAETAAWSADGRMLAFTNLADVFLADPDGIEPKKLVTANGDIQNVVWSPDGLSLRFDTSSTDGGFGRQFTWEVVVDGKSVRRLLPSGWREPTDECCGKWTADGRFFVFESNGQIWALPRKRSVFHSEPEPVQLTSSPLRLSSPLPSKDGKKLFVVGQSHRGQLMRYDTKSRQFLPHLGGISAEYVDVSNDGQWIAYVSYPQGNLWRSRSNGSERMQLTYAPAYAMLPRWSPDAKEIIFFEFESTSDKTAGMYEVSREGGIPRQLVPKDQRHQKDPNWSADGSQIVFGGEANDPASVVLILERATGKVLTVPGSQGLFSPRWSPDGRYIVACSADSMKLVYYEFATRKWVDLAHGPLGWPNWSRNGQYVYYLGYSGTGAVMRVRLADRKSQEVVALKDFVTAGRYDGSLSLASDDSPLLLRYTGIQDVYALDWQAP